MSVLDVEIVGERQASQLPRAALRIRWCPMSKLRELQQFIGTYWRKNHVFAHDPQLLAWQYPRDDDSLSFFIMEEADRIIAILGLIPATFHVHGSKMPAYWPAIWTKATDIEEKGVGQQLMRLALEQRVGLVGIIGASDVAMSIYKKLGFILADDLPRWVRGFDRESLCKLIDLAPEATSGFTLYRDWPDTCENFCGYPPDGAFKVLWPGVVPDGWDACWNRLAHTMVGTWRDRDWLHHRYADHPTLRYQMLFAQDGGGWIEGCAIYRIANTGTGANVMRIVELMGSEAAVDALTWELCEHAKYYQVAYADFHCASSRFGKPLESRGFIRQETRETRLPVLLDPLDFGRPKLTMALKPLQFAPEVLAEAIEKQELYITRGDTDQDRPNTVPEHWMVSATGRSGVA